MKRFRRVAGSRAGCWGPRLRELQGHHSTLCCSASCRMRYRRASSGAQWLTKWNTASPAAGSGTSSLAISQRRPNSTRAGMSLVDYACGGVTRKNASWGGPARSAGSRRQRRRKQGHPGKAGGRARRLRTAILALTKRSNCVPGPRGRYCAELIPLARWRPPQALVSSWCMPCGASEALWQPRCGVFKAQQHSAAGSGWRQRRPSAALPPMPSRKS